MTGYLAFLKKELTENLRTYRCMILFFLFIIIGIISPISAKFLPELLSIMDLQGMVITLPDPTALDSYVQFYSNTTQIGLVALVIIYSGLLASDLTKGTLVLLLTKGLSRSSVILAKLSSSILFWTGGLLLSFGITYGYTAYIFNHNDIYHLMFSLFCLWLFGCFLLCLLLLAGALSGRTSGTMLITGGIICLLFLANLIPAIAEKSPLLLASANTAMLDSGYDLATAYPALIITIILSLLCLLGATLIFRKKKYNL